MLNMLGVYVTALERIIIDKGLATHDEVVEARMMVVEEERNKTNTKNQKEDK